MKKQTTKSGDNNPVKPYADPFIIRRINAGLDGSSVIMYRGQEIKMPNLTSERFKLFGSFKDKLIGDVVSDFDYGILVPELLNPKIYSNDELTILSSIMMDWLRDTIKRNPDKKDDLIELKNFISEYIKPILNSSQQELLVTPEMKVLKERYTLLLELGIIDYLHKTFDLEHKPGNKIALLAMILGVKASQIKPYVYLEKDTTNKDRPRTPSLIKSVWEKLQSIDIYKPKDK